MDGELSPDDLAALLDSDETDDVRVVDIRDATSFDRERIPDSENVPFHELPDRVEEFEDADRIVTVCPHGEASVQAARLVASYEGCEARVESMAGGLEAWGNSYELVSADSSGASADDGSRPDAPF